jgi:hypothetical protein
MYIVQDDMSVYVSIWSTMGHHMLTVVQLDMWSTTVMDCSFCVTVPGEEIQQTCSSLWIIPVFSFTCMYLCSFFLYFAMDMSRKTDIIYVFCNTRFMKSITNKLAMSVYLSQQPFCLWNSDKNLYCECLPQNMWK